MTLQDFSNLAKYSYQQNSMFSPQNKKNYYEVLAISAKATPEDIRKAYKKMAIKWHPDKNLDNKQIAQQRFRQIAEAYQILSDDKKKQDYDDYGYQPRRTYRHSKFNYQDADNLFKKMFKNTGFDSPEDQAFFSAFHRKKSQTCRKKYGFNSMFDDQNFWNSGLGKMGGFSSFGSPKFGSPGKIKRTINTVKQIINGKLVIIKTTTISKSDGSQRITQQKTDEDGNKISFKKYDVQKQNQTKVAV